MSCSYSSSQSCSQSCEDEDIEDEPDFLFVKPSADDKRKAEENGDLVADSVWFDLKPPNRTNTIYQPFVSARQVEIIRTVLMGKNLPKVDLIEFPGVPNPPAKLSTKISSVKNLKKDKTDSSD